eukprot:14147.XXX_309429_307257_1 [CDS] Oithona nana genome sequencing.
MDQRGMIVLAGNSHPELARAVTKQLDVRLSKTTVHHKTNRETVVDIHESVRGKDVYIIQTGSKDVNNSIMEMLIMCYACKSNSCGKVIGVIPYLPYSAQSKDINNTVMEMLIMAYACKTSNAKKIVGVLPYMPYSRQCKMISERSAIVGKLLAQMMVMSGFTQIITMDLHQKELQGFFDCPVDNLRASPFFITYIVQHIPDYRNAVIVAKSPLAAKRATSYAERLKLGIAVIHGEVKDDEDDDVGRASPPPSFSNRVTSVGIALPPLMGKEKPPINVVGDVGGRIAIMVDDMIDDVKSFIDAAHILKDRGAYKIYVLATHGILSADAPTLIDESPIDEVVVTNTVPHDLQKLQCHKIKTVDISILLAEAMRRIHNKESMSHLFRHVTLED